MPPSKPRHLHVLSKIFDFFSLQFIMLYVLVILLQNTPTCFSQENTGNANLCSLLCKGDFPHKVYSRSVGFKCQMSVPICYNSKFLYCWVFLLLLLLFLFFRTQNKEKGTRTVFIIIIIIYAILGQQFMDSCVMQLDFTQHNYDRGISKRFTLCLVINDTSCFVLVYIYSKALRRLDSRSGFCGQT